MLRTATFLSSTYVLGKDPKYPSLHFSKPRIGLLIRGPDFGGTRTGRQSVTVGIQGCEDAHAITSCDVSFSQSVNPIRTNGKEIGWIAEGILYLAVFNSRPFVDCAGPPSATKHRLKALW